jgi:hypothetical protein
VPKARFSAQPVDATFFDTAPFILRETFAISRPAQQVWDDLVMDGTLSWCRIINSVTWTSPRPFGVGTTRRVRALGGLNVIEEFYFRWEEGTRKSFYVERASAPLFKQFAEDYIVEPTGDSACRFTWTIAADPKMPGAMADPLNGKLLGTLFKDTRKHYSA